MRCVCREAALWVPGRDKQLAWKAEAWLGSRLCELLAAPLLPPQWLTRAQLVLWVRTAASASPRGGGAGFLAGSRVQEPEAWVQASQM